MDGGAGGGGGRPEKLPNFRCGQALGRLCLEAAACARVSAPAARLERGLHGLAALRRPRPAGCARRPRERAHASARRAERPVRRESGSSVLHLGASAAARNDAAHRSAPGRQRCISESRAAPGQGSARAD